MIAAVVTGAAMGIGQSIARRLIEEGATVVGVDRDPAALEQTASLLGDRLVPMVGDIAEGRPTNALLISPSSTASWRGG